MTDSMGRVSVRSTFEQCSCGYDDCNGSIYRVVVVRGGAVIDRWYEPADEPTGAHVAHRFKALGFQAEHVEIRGSVGEVTVSIEDRALRAEGSE